MPPVARRSDRADRAPGSGAKQRYQHQRLRSAAHYPACAGRAPAINEEIEERRHPDQHEEFTALSDIVIHWPAGFDAAALRRRSGGLPPCYRCRCVLCTSRLAADGRFRFTPTVGGLWVSFRGPTTDLLIAIDPLSQKRTLRRADPNARASRQELDARSSSVSLVERQSACSHQAQAVDLRPVSEHFCHGIVSERRE